MKVIDLSTSLYSGVEVFEGDPEVKIQLVHTYEKNNWQLRKIEMGSHTGTHVDTPSHMHRGKDCLDDLTLERFFGQAQVLKLDENFPKGIGLFFIEEIGEKWLDKILKANPRFVGGNITERLERALLDKEIITYTGLVNLDLIAPGKTFMFYGLPLKIKEGDGSPVRAMAVIED
nr:cyclase family protein [Tissierella sp.]